MKHILALLAVVALSGCHTKDFSIPQDDVLSPDVRTELKLPPTDVLTLAAKPDVEYAAKLPLETVSAVKLLLKPVGTEVSIDAARPIGSYFLLWISFPKIADGGIDLIWSVDKQKPVGYFLGGYRG
jgi:hypothetical protein